MSRSILVPPAVLLLAVVTAAVGSGPVTGIFSSTDESRESASSTGSTEQSTNPIGDRVTLSMAERALELDRTPKPRRADRRVSTNLADRRATLRRTFDELLSENGYRANVDSIDVDDLGRTVRRRLAGEHARTGRAARDRSVLGSVMRDPIHDAPLIDPFPPPRIPESQVGTTSESASSEVSTRDVAPVWRR